MPTPIDEIFGEHGILAQKLPGYEMRASQINMANAVLHTLAIADTDLLSTAQMLVAEAETGIGKTLAYLVPALLSGQKVVISTGTLNLQEQILKKEIPFIRQHIKPDLKAICVKGRQNYACLHRCQQFLSAPQMQLFAQSHEIELLHDWLGETHSGDRAELTWLADNSPLWEQVSTSTSKCLGNTCPENANCFINRLRKKAATAQLLIVNHHLFFSDLAIRRFGHAEVLPRYQSVIFDEAHHLENVATSYFGTTFSHYQLLDLVKDIETMAQEHLKKEARLATIQIARALASQAAEFALIFPRQKGRFPLPELIDNIKEWGVEVSRLDQAITNLRQQLNSTALGSDYWDGPRRRCQELQDCLAKTTTDLDHAFVYWAERREKTISLSASPIEIAQALQKHLYSQVASIVFTSATLTTGGSFSYMFKRLGLPSDTESMSLPTPFDYARRSRLYIPAQGFPEPNAATYASAIQRQTLAILAASRGRALLLFTSISAMRQMHEFLDDKLNHPLLMQGDAPKASLLETFREMTDSVLLAVASFWEGVNVPGESLSCVIIDKLPFEVPSDPVIMARINRIKEEKGNPFYDFQVPRAILSLRQGLGRLMRAKNDRGLLAIMDIRLYTKGYGRLFLKSLPPSPIIRNIDEATHFFMESEE
ncbi:MAG: ATP-dependent DNA helicase [Desulfobulbaceae bacterium]|nr:ATP-dependent DNA helicase [Desulfobulbaceae bacterium]